MSEMIERVARAIHASLGYEAGWPHPECTQCIDAARAAIEAMREPTDEMCYAAGLRQYSAGTYREMIRAALKPPAKASSPKTSNAEPTAALGRPE